MNSGHDGRPYHGQNPSHKESPHHHPDRGIGHEIVRSSSDTLVGSGCIDTFQIEEVVNRLEGIRGCHDIRTRGTSHAVFVDLHVLVDPALSIGEAQRIADSVEAALKEHFPSVADIIVHTEPERKG